MRQRILRKRQSEANSLARFYVHNVGCFLASSPSSSCDRVGTGSCIHMNSSWSRELQQHKISSYLRYKNSDNIVKFLSFHSVYPTDPPFCLPEGLGTRFMSYKVKLGNTYRVTNDGWLEVWGVVLQTMPFLCWAWNTLLVTVVVPLVRGRRVVYVSLPP